MLVFSGKGVLLPIIIIVCLIGSAFAVGAAKGPLPFLEHLGMGITFSIGFALSAAWTHFVKDTYYVKDGKKVILEEVENSFFYIPLKYWVYILSVASIVCCVESITG